MVLDPSELERRRARFLERTEHYRRLGHDRVATAHWVVAVAGELRGPALDVGTGKGLLARALSQRGLAVHSIDVDEEEQALAAHMARREGLGQGVSWLRAHAARLPFGDGAFGCVAMMDVLHHLGSADEVFGEAARVLAPAGTIVLAEFSPAGFDLVDRVHRSEGRRHAVGPVTLDRSVELLATRGLRKVGGAEAHLHEVVVLARG